MSAAGNRLSRPENRLVRRGFTDPEAAVRRLSAPALVGLADDPILLDALGATADPDLALLGLARLLEALPDDERQALRDTLTASKPLRDRLLGVLGASAALADHLATHPRDWHALVTFELRDIHPGIADFRQELEQQVRDSPAEPADALRAAYRRCLLTIAARDLSDTADFEQTAAELADLAGATLRTALQIAAEQEPAAADACRLAVIGMGKCGGRELNYVSDVDVIFVAEAREGVEESRALQAATRLAAAMMRLCSDTTREGTIWPVDANLRPEGRNGPLVRTLASHLAYYQRWAKTWEFQALLKARPVAGDAELGEAYVTALAPMVWQAAERENFVADVQQMRRRVIDAIPLTEVDRQLKLGPGGLRDVEFSVQLLQLVHGRTDPELRSGNTLTALRALSAGGYVGRADAAALDSAYRFLRSLEHRIQLHRLRRTHLMPTDPADLRLLARSLAPMINDDTRADPVAALNREWKRHALEVRRLHEKLFYRPLLTAVANLSGGEALTPGTPAMTPEAAKARLEALGFADPPPRCATCRRWPAGSAGRRRSSGPCCRCCWPGSATRPTRMPGCWGSARSPTRSAARPGTCGCCGTRAPRPRTWPGCCRPAGWRPTCCCGRRRRWRCWAIRAVWRRAAARRWRARSWRRWGGRRAPPRRWRRPARCAAASCSAPRPGICSAGSATQRHLRVGPRRWSWPPTRSPISTRPPCPAHWPAASRTGSASTGAAAGPDRGDRDGPVRRP